MGIRRLMCDGVGCVVAAGLLASPALGQGSGSAQLSSRPLDEAARALQSTYATPVTYEDPVLFWRGDMDGREVAGSTRFTLKDRAFALPDDLTPARTPQLDATSLGRALDLYHQLNSDGPRFRLIQSRYALHIVPESVRDENGQRTGVTPLLDAVITVPPEARLPSGHVKAICDAVSAATGVSLGFFGPYVDTQYAPNGLIPPKPQLLSLEDEATRRQFYFTWGASAATAREALVSLLEGSETTLSWGLLCSPNGEPGKRACMLNMAAMEVAVMGSDGRPSVRALELDRCNRNCQPLPMPVSQPPKTAVPGRPLH